MKNKAKCAAIAHERAAKGFGLMNGNLGRSLMCAVIILGLIFGLSGGVSATCVGTTQNFECADTA